MDAIEKVADGLDTCNQRLQAFAGVERDILEKPHAPGKWNGIQILAHIAEGDMVCYTRLHQAIAEPSDTLFPVPLDGDLLMEKLKCELRPVEVSLAAINGARQGMVHTLRCLPTEVLQRSLKHEEMGTVSPLTYTQVSLKHGLHHLEQLDSIVSSAREM